eukprot:3879499-Pleurochrysis_carterae.AAC.1
MHDVHEAASYVAREAAGLALPQTKWGGIEKEAGKGANKVGRYRGRREKEPADSKGAMEGDK